MNWNRTNKLLQNELKQNEIVWSSFHCLYIFIECVYSVSNVLKQLELYCNYNLNKNYNIYNSRTKLLCLLLVPPPNSYISFYVVFRVTLSIDSNISNTFCLLNFVMFSTKTYYEKRIKSILSLISNKLAIFKSIKNY